MSEGEKQQRSTNPSQTPPPTNPQQNGVKPSTTPPAPAPNKEGSSK